MGVMACNRTGCDCVMCNRYSPHYGYICSNCFEDLIKTGANTDIKSFMNSENYIDDTEEAEARYNITFQEI